MPFTRPVRVHVVTGGVAPQLRVVCPAAIAVTVYAVVAGSPLLTPGDHVTTAAVSPGVTIRFDGDDGTTGAAVTIKVRETSSDAPVASTAIIETLVVPDATGVPVSAPLDDIERPAGRPVAVQVYGAVPPDTVGADAVYATPTLPSGNVVAAAESVGYGLPRRVGPVPDTVITLAATPPMRTPDSLAIATVADGAYTAPRSESTLLPLAMLTALDDADHSSRLA